MKLIIDGSNLIHRSYWVSERINKSVVELFLNSLRKLYNDWSPEVVYVVWDARLIKDQKNFRRQEATYKSDRDKDRWKKVYAQEKLIRSLCECLGLYNLFPGVLEADDFIFYISKNQPGKKVIITSDQDLLQAIDSNTAVYNPVKKSFYDTTTFKDHYPVSLECFVQYKALIGDKSDNIAGISGVGPKRAVRIISKGIKDSLSESEYKIYENNIKLVDLNQAMKFHPEEKSIYEYQLKKSKDLKSSHKKFTNICEDNDINLQYDFSCFFDNEINNAVIEILK